MFGIEMTTMQKLEVAFICVIMGVAGIFIFRSFQPSFDTAINAFTLHRVHPVNDPRGVLPVTTTNPRDPKKDETVTMIVVADGKLEIIAYPNDPLRHLDLKWMPERRLPGLPYQYYHDPMARIEEFSDPFMHALAYAVYNQVNGRSLGLLKNANMTNDQLPKEALARDVLNKEIKSIEASVEGGTLGTALLAKVSTALAAYDAKPGDPTTDKEKADLARRLLDAANNYFDAIQAERDKAIDKYMGEVAKLLSADQKKSFVDGYEAYTKRTSSGSTAVRGRVNTIAPTVRGTAPARGGAGRAARGAAATGQAGN